MKIIIQDKTHGAFKTYKYLIYKTVKFILCTHDIFNNKQKIILQHKNKLELSFLILNNQEIKILNKKFRNHNTSTDVLSFPMLDFNNLNPNIFLQTQILLGDIVISFEKTCEQANNNNHSVKQELIFLITHGFLHLIGEDHVSLSESKIMFAKQKKILHALIN